jgi:transposase
VWQKIEHMTDAAVVRVVKRGRRAWPVLEKRRIVQQTMEPGRSVSEVALSYGLNTNQLFRWRRMFERGELMEPCAALLPVSLVPTGEPARKPGRQAHGQAPTPSSIHIEFIGRATISVEHGADPALLRVILESMTK